MDRAVESQISGFRIVCRSGYQLMNGLKLRNARPRSQDVDVKVTIY